jgi:uncharacterized membrane protein
MWFLGLLIGSLLLSLLWYIERTHAMTFSNWWLKVIPVMDLAELAYWYAFRNSPNWFVARYTMSAMTNTFGILMAVIFLKEGVEFKQAIGIVLIISGGYLLK